MQLRSAALLAGNRLTSTWAQAASALLSRPLAQQRLSTIADPDPDEALLYAQQLQQPTYVQQVSINQLDSLVRHPSLKLLCNSATFLKQQLPARLSNHIHRLQALPPPEHPQLKALLASTISSKANGLEVAKDWRLVGTGDLGELRHFESHLSTFREHLEVEVAKLTSSSQALTESRGWWGAANETQVRWLNRLLDLSHWYLLSARIMLNQHSAALAALEAAAAASPSSTASSPSSRLVVAHYHEPGHASTQPDQPYAPPHVQLASPGGGGAVSLIRRHTPLRELVENVAEDCRAFCIEKNSAAPDVKIVGGDGLTATLVVPYVEFVLTEVLKNAMQAVIARYGAWEVDDAQPVLVELRELQGSAAAGSSAGGEASAAASAAAGGEAGGGSRVQIVVTDAGNGIPPKQATHMHYYFFSANKATSALSSYGYSRSHGSQFQGIGVGVPMSRVYSHFMGGSIEWETDSWQRHTTVTLSLPKHGFVF